MGLRAGAGAGIGSGSMRAAFRANDSEAADPAEKIEFVPADYFARAQVGDIFAREAPLEIDFGCGEGAFLVALAARHPERNFLGIERLLGRVRKVCRMVVHHRLENTRLLRIETAYALRYVLPPASVTTAHVLFPDPWPKRHHQSRRVIQDGFMEAMHGALVAGGELRVKTDDEPYFLWMEKVFARAQGYERLDWPEGEEYPQTNFERRFLAQGLPIYRARLRKV
jgi:tRNA (guanine-N7-)-methyltransferase